MKSAAETTDSTKVQEEGAVEEIEVKTPAKKVETQYKKLDGPNFTGQKIDLAKFKKPEKKKPEVKPSDPKDKKSKRRRISKEPQKGGTSGRDNRGPGRKGIGRTNVPKEEPSEEEVQKQVRETLEKLQGKSSKGKGAKYRREKRDSSPSKDRR